MLPERCEKNDHFFPNPSFGSKLIQKIKDIYQKINSKKELIKQSRHERVTTIKRVKYFSLRITAAATTALQLSKNTSKKAPKNLSRRKLSNQIATP